MTCKHQVQENLRKIDKIFSKVLYNAMKNCYIIKALLWKLSSAGRASALQAEGHRFEPYSFHQMREWLSGRASPCQGECRESESRLPLHTQFVPLAQLVEHLTLNQGVQGSSP